MRRALRFVPPLALLLSLAGCALIGESPAHVGGRSTLGDAASAARPDSSDKRRVLDTGYTLPPSSREEVEVSSGYDEGGGPHSSSTAPGNGHLRGGMLGPVVGGGTIGGTRYDGFAEFGLELAILADERWRVDVLGCVSPIEFADASIAGQSFDGEFDLEFDLAARYSLTPLHTFMGVAPIVGVRFGTLFWDYAKPLLVVEDGRLVTVEDDHINHFSVYAGLGTELARFRHVQLGAALLAGSRFYSWTSYQGFSNTLFPAAGFVQVRTELLFGGVDR